MVVVVVLADAVVAADMATDVDMLVVEFNDKEEEVPEEGGGGGGGGGGKEEGGAPPCCCCLAADSALRVRSAAALMVFRGYQTRRCFAVSTTEWQRSRRRRRRLTNERKQPSWSHGAATGKPCNSACTLRKEP